MEGEVEVGGEGEGEEVEVEVEGWKTVVSWGAGTGLGWDATGPRK